MFCGKGQVYLQKRQITSIICCVSDIHGWSLWARHPNKALSAVTSRLRQQLPHICFYATWKLLHKTSVSQMWGQLVGHTVSRDAGVKQFQMIHGPERDRCSSTVFKTTQPNISTYQIWKCVGNTRRNNLVASGLPCTWSLIRHTQKNISPCLWLCWVWNYSMSDSLSWPSPTHPSSLLWGLGKALSIIGLWF